MSSPAQATPPINRAAVDIDGAPKIMLGGVEFPIPILAFKQNRVIEPLLWKVLPIYHKLLAMAEQSAKAKADLATDGDLTPDQKAANIAAANGRFIEAMQGVTIDEASIDDLAIVVHTAITRGTPGFARAEFDGLAFGSNDLFEALNVILPQTGMFRKAMAARASEGDSKMGEAQAES